MPIKPQPGNTPPNNPTMLNHTHYVNGYPDGTFRPEQPIQRSEMAALLANAFDDTRNHWAKKYIAGVNEAGWMKGYADQTFCPEQPITRAEAVTALNCCLEEAR
ncbi:hypothetical protein GJ688_19345 [Heliobacillus mobilis]|uniref:SLH domain-containing protein n=1 Tax=Heliobacterium mobile TaxID=28064 RepID=A0A6I3SQR5_HELMO|nr:S-layer homology domain-containing protein [Heliobacterium mobile]MTV51056.1 hypothetical protein [Heliobacterium mobile]